MALLSGTAGSVVYGGTAGTAIEGMKSWTLDVAVGELDASSFGSTWKLTEGGVKEWSGSAEGNADDGTAMQASAWTALTAGTKVVMLFVALAYATCVARPLASVRMGLPGGEPPI